MSQTRRTKQPLQAQPLPVQGGEQVSHQVGLRCETFSRKEAAIVLGISGRTLDRLIEQGELRYIGSTHRLSQQRVRAYLHDSQGTGRAA